MRRNKLKWYFNRLSLMTPFEIGYRFKEWLKKKLEKYFMRDFTPKISLMDKKLFWYFKEQDRDEIFSFLKNKGMWDESVARDLLEHRFTFFSFKRKYLGKTMEWNRDYKNNKAAPLNYSRDIDYRDFSKVGDYRYIWEMNRHQHLISLAKTYYLTGNNEYKNEVIQQITSWINSNPYMKGINWASALEVGIRLIAWSWVWYFIGEEEERFKRFWLENIYKHCHFISRNFSKYSSANNHLIGEAAALFIASIVWPFERKSDEWQKKAYEILIQEIEKQNYSDGVNKEQSTAYQQFVLDFFLLAGLLGEKNGIRFPHTYWQMLERMLDFIASVMDRNGNIPLIGDSDDGCAIILSENENFNNYKSLLASGAILFERGDLKAKAGSLDEKSLWLFRIDGIEKFNALKEEKIIPTSAFKEGGYYIFNGFSDREGEIHGVFDCGPLGYLSIAAHGHADALSFTLSVGGKEFLIDPGTYTYCEQKWRDYFRGTAAHNTIRIDGQDQSVTGGNFMWLRKAQIRLLKWESDGHYVLVQGEHNGYSRLKDPVIHQREIIFDKKENIFKIKDRIEAKGLHLVEQFFHFSEECDITPIKPQKWQITNQGKSLIIRVDKNFQTMIINGDTDPILGWKSYRFDLKKKINTMVNTTDFEGPFEFETSIIVCI